jgi:hypothetical protein
MCSLVSLMIDSPLHVYPRIFSSGVESNVSSALSILKMAVVSFFLHSCSSSTLIGDNMIVNNNR